MFKKIWEKLWGGTTRGSARQASFELDNEPSRQQTEPAYSEIYSRLENTPTRWKDDPSGEAMLIASKYVSAPGLGIFGLISLEGKITPDDNKYKCFVRAVCLPIASDATETADSLDAARQLINQMMATQAAALALILDTMKS